MEYKVVTYIGINYSKEYIDKINLKFLNKIGNYQNCFSTMKVKSHWTSLPGSHALIGKVNEESIEEEIRIELTVSKNDLKNVIKILKDNHPYEEPEINIYPFYNYKNIDEII